MLQLARWLPEKVRFQQDSRGGVGWQFGGREGVFRGGERVEWMADQAQWRLSEVSLAVS